MSGNRRGRRRSSRRGRRRSSRRGRRRSSRQRSRGRRRHDELLPPESRRCTACTLVILYHDGRRTAQVHVDRVGLRSALIDPPIQLQSTIHVHPHAVVALAEEPVHARHEHQLPGPADREVVRRQPCRGRSRRPGKVDHAVVARQHRRTRQVPVAPVLAHPVRIADLARPLPAQCNPSQTRALVVFDADLVLAAGQREVCAHLACAAVAPLVDEKLAVHPQPRAVVHAQSEPVGPRGKVQRARPAG